MLLKKCTFSLKNNNFFSSNYFSWLLKSSWFIHWLLLPEVFLNGSEMIPKSSQCAAEGFSHRTKGGRRKLFTTREDCLVHFKLWPALYCLWCLSFNRLVDIMNEPDPPSATPERSLVLSELRSTLGALGQSRRSPPKQSAGPKEELVFLRV